MFGLEAIVIHERPHSFLEYLDKLRQDLAADGAYATTDNLAKAKGLGVKHIDLHKRAGIEAMISYLKRCFGLSRCTWKGLDHFKAYVHSVVFTHNLVVLTQRIAASG